MSRTKSDQIIAALLEWEATMGGFESPIWEWARTHMNEVRDNEGA